MKYWHIIILLIAFALMVSIIRGDANSTPIDYISGLGSVASIYAIIIALVEIRTVKKTTRETKKAVEKKLDEINNFLSYAEVEKHLEKCTSIAPYLQGEQYEAAALRLEELKKILLEIKNNKAFTEKSDYEITQMVMRIGSDVKSMRRKWTEQEEIDLGTVYDHVNEVSTFLQEISTKLKNQTL